MGMLYAPTASGPSAHFLDFRTSSTAHLTSLGGTRNRRRNFLPSRVLGSEAFAEVNSFHHSLLRWASRILCRRTSFTRLFAALRTLRCCKAMRCRRRVLALCSSTARAAALSTTCLWFWRCSRFRTTDFHNAATHTWSTIISTTINASAPGIPPAANSARSLGAMAIVPCNSPLGKWRCKRKSSGFEGFGS